MPGDCLGPSITFIAQYDLRSAQKYLWLKSQTTSYNSCLCVCGSFALLTRKTRLAVVVKTLSRGLRLLPWIAWFSDLDLKRVQRPRCRPTDNRFRLHSIYDQQPNLLRHRTHIWMYKCTKRITCLSRPEGQSRYHYLQALWKLSFASVEACLSDPKVVFLSDHEFQHFNIHNPDLDVTNITISYDDTTLVTGIINWEGSAVLPTWSVPTGDRLLEGSVPELNAIRRQIFNEAILRCEEPRDAVDEFSSNIHYPSSSTALLPGWRGLRWTIWFLAGRIMWKNYNW